MKKQEYGPLEKEILRLLKERPRPAYAVAQLLGIDKLAAYTMIKRLKSHGHTYYHNGRWHWLPEPTTIEGSMFPAPKYKTKCVGWWG